MTEKSYFHNGTFTGDATIAPYNDIDFHAANDVIYHNEDFYSNVEWSSGGTVAVNVNFSAGQTVHVLSYGIMVKGVYIECDEDVVLENNDTAYNRLDTIVFRIDWNTRTVNLLAVRGAPADAPEPATLRQEFGDIWEHPIAYCYIKPSFTDFDGTYIYNLRGEYYYYYNYYLPTAPNEIFGFWYPNNKNILHNSDFLSGPATAGDGVAPAMWSTTGSPSIDNDTYYPYISSRNTNPLHITLTSTDTFYTVKYLADSRYKPMTVSCVVQVISGELKLSCNGGVSTSRRIGPTALPTEQIAQVAFSGGTDVVTPHFSTDDEVEFYLWYVHVSPLFLKATNTPTHEYVLYGYPKELFTTTSPFNEEFDPDAGDGNLIVQTFASAISAAGDQYAVLYPPSQTLEALRTEIGFLPNARARENQGWVSTKPNALLAPKLFYTEYSLTLGVHTINSVGILT